MEKESSKLSRRKMWQNPGLGKKKHLLNLSYVFLTFSSYFLKNMFLLFKKLSSTLDKPAKLDSLFFYQSK